LSHGKRSAFESYRLLGQVPQLGEIARTRQERKLRRHLYVAAQRGCGAKMRERHDLRDDSNKLAVRRDSRAIGKNIRGLPFHTGRCSARLAR
jgi:hypothetical protein